MHSKVISNWNGLRKGLGLSKTTTLQTCTYVLKSESILSCKTIYVYVENKLLDAKLLKINDFPKFTGIIGITNKEKESNDWVIVYLCHVSELLLYSEILKHEVYSLIKRHILLCFLKNFYTLF